MFDDVVQTPSGFAYHLFSHLSHKDVYENSPVLDTQGMLDILPKLYGENRLSFSYCDPTVGI